MLVTAGSCSLAPFLDVRTRAGSEPMLGDWSMAHGPPAPAAPGGASRHCVPAALLLYTPDHPWGWGVRSGWGRSDLWSVEENWPNHQSVHLC